MAETLTAPVEDYKYGFSSPEDYVFKAEKGLDEKIVRQISEMKDEPEWMLENASAGLQPFHEAPHAKLG